MPVERVVTKAASRALVISLLFVVAACSRSPSRRPPGGPNAGRESPAHDLHVDVAHRGEDVPSLDALAARGSGDMSTMHEVSRSSEAAKPTEVRAASSDACFRAVVAASEPIRAHFEDETHAPRGAELSATSGLVPPRGPACARKGETLRLVVTPKTENTIARAIVWQAP